MRKPTPLMKLARQWLALTAELQPLCGPEGLDLAALDPRQVEQLRTEAQALGERLGAWQDLQGARRAAQASARPALPFERA